MQCTESSGQWLWSLAAQQTDDMVYALDGAGNQTLVNAAGRAMQELPEDADCGRPWLGFMHEDDRAAAARTLERVLSGAAESEEFEGRIVGLRGGITCAVHRLWPVRDDMGTVTGAAGLARDVSTLRRLREQLLQAQKLENIGLLAGGIAHDFNNMLAAILGYTELMLEEKEPDDPDYRALTYIQTGTERASALARQLLLFGRRTAVEMKPVAIGPVIRETLQILQRTLPKSIRIIDRGSDNTEQVMGDSGRLQQAVMNLCLNARDAMPAGGELRIEVDRVPADPSVAAVSARAPLDEYVRIRVQDTGQGMAPEVLERMWEPFYTTKATEKGSGLGLSVVRGIVEAHRGHIQVESQPARGTAFYLLLPVASAFESAAAQAAMVEPAGGTETVLCVDDEPLLLTLVSDILRSKGYRVLTAASAAEALEYVNALPDSIQLYITDNMMPGMSGSDLAREIRRRLPDARIVMCSGYSPVRTEEQPEPGLADAYVGKPYQRRELLTLVRAVLDAARAPGEEPGNEARSGRR